MSDLDRVLYWQGINDSFYNFRGDLVHIPVENRKQLLFGMGIDVSTQESTAKAAFELDVEPWKEWCPPLQTCRIGGDLGFNINVLPNEASKVLSWRIFHNGKYILSGQFTPNELMETGNYLYELTRYSRRFVPVNINELGYYHLEVQLGEKKSNTVYAVVPAHVYQPDWLTGKCSVWGLVVQLYTLKSERNWGIGDFGDLRYLISHSVKYGVDLIGLNPFHALLPNVEYHRSPYSPSDRRFINSLYVDMESVKEFVAEDLLSLNDRQSIEELRGNPMVDYVRVKQIKNDMFKKMFARFKAHEIDPKTQRSQEFFDFVADQGQALEIFCFYEMLSAENNDNVPDVDLPHAFERYKLANNGNDKEGVLFYSYVQWLAHSQLDACQKFAKEQGMTIGLIRDLAVGADGGGAEVRSNSDLFCDKAAIGAPPDPMALKGQNWGLPPMIPSSIRSSGYTHFIQLLHDNMVSCGALRIDHVMSMMRLWWCPPGQSAQNGAYVHYPLEQMMDLLALESHINQCVIIGEDLGVVPDEFREAMSHAKLLSNKVFYFEKHNNGDFKSPKDIAQHAFTTINNHDVPTLVSWWNGSDLDLRKTLNLLEEGVDFNEVCDYRMFEKERLIHVLRDEQLLPSDESDSQLNAMADMDLIKAILMLGARVKSQVYAIQLEDLLLMDEPVNVPGTFNEYPNWQRKLSMSLETMFARSDIQAVLMGINNERANL